MASDGDGGHNCMASATDGSETLKMKGPEASYSMSCHHICSEHHRKQLEARTHSKEIFSKTNGTVRRELRSN